MNGEAPELFLADAERLPDPPTSLQVTPFASDTIDRPLPGLSGLIELLLARLRRHAGATIGIEPDETPAAVLTALMAGLPGLQMVDASSAPRHLRMIKTLDERALLRAAVRLTDTGQQTAKRMARLGMTEIELYGEIHKSMEMMAWTRVPILPDVLSGTRTAEVGGPPSDRAMTEGELVLIDLVPRLHGWASRVRCNA
jgi:Xaa-Pro aminopeptidase